MVFVQHSTDSDSQRVMNSDSSLASVSPVSIAPLNGSSLFMRRSNNCHRLLILAFLRESRKHMKDFQTVADSLNLAISNWSSPDEQRPVPTSGGRQCNRQSPHRRVFRSGTRLATLCQFVVVNPLTIDLRFTSSNEPKRIRDVVDAVLNLLLTSDGT
jgi:hypothetical protein